MAGSLRVCLGDLRSDQGLGQQMDGMFTAKLCTHLDLPLAGLAVGDDQIRLEAVYLIKQPFAYGRLVS